MTTQNLGSFSSPGIFDYYDSLCTMEGNDFLQVHRYLDCGGELDVCRGPMDVPLHRVIWMIRMVSGLLREDGVSCTIQ